MLNRYSKVLYEYIVDLRKGELNQFFKTIYLSGCSIIDFIKLTNFKNPIQWLKEQNIYKMIKCQNCNQILPRTEFNKHKKSGFYKKNCKTCTTKLYTEKRRIYDKKPNVIQHRKKYINNHKLRPDIHEKMKAYDFKYKQQPHVKLKIQKYDQEYKSRPDIIKRQLEHDKQYVQSFASINRIKNISQTVISWSNVNTNKDYTKVQCHYCGKYFKPLNSQINGKLKALNCKNPNLGFEHNLYCSEECKQSCPTYNQVLYPKDLTRINLSNEVTSEFRHIVLKRDNYA